MRRPAGLRVHICKDLQPGRPCLIRPESFLLKLVILWVHLTNIVQEPPSLGLSILYGRQVSTLWDNTQAMDDPMAQPVLGVFYWLPSVLLPCESWFWVIPRHNTAWLYFPYSVSRCSTSEISKGSIKSLRYGTSTAFLAVLLAARTPQSLPSKKSEMRWRSGRLLSQMPCLFWRAMADCIAIGSCAAAEPLVSFLVLHEPMDVQLHCMIKKGFSWRGKNTFFSHTTSFDAVLVPYLREPRLR